METTPAAGPQTNPASPAVRAGRLWLYGLGMLVPAGYFAARYPLRGHTDELRDIGQLAGYAGEELVWYCAGCAVLFACYVLAVLECRRLPPGRTWPVVFGGGAILAGALAWMYPVNAIDIFIYAVRSRLWTEYGENPNAVLPAVHWDTDPYMAFAMAEWARETSPYGPLWNLVAAPATLLGGDSVGTALVVYKLLAVVCLLLGGWVIFATLKVVRPADAATGALVYLWNPLVLWEGAGNGHNDVLLALLLLLAVLVWARRWLGLVVPLLVAAALVKYVGLLLLPLAAVALWRRTRTWYERWRVALQSVAGSLLVCLVGFAPFYDVRAVIESAERQSEFVSTSPAGMAIAWLREPVGEPWLSDAVKLVGLGIVVLVLGWLLADVWVDPERLPRASFVLLFVLLLVATWSFRGWYLIWPTALVALLPLGWPFWRMLVWTVSGLLVYAHYIWFAHWWELEYDAYRDVGVLILFGPVAAVGLAEVAHALLARSDRAASVAPGHPDPVGADRFP